MTVAEFRQKATNLDHRWDNMDAFEFIMSKDISYIDKLHAIYGHIGSEVPYLYKLDCKNILGIDVGLKSTSESKKS